MPFEVPHYLNHSRALFLTEDFVDDEADEKHRGHDQENKHQQDH